MTTEPDLALIAANAFYGRVGRMTNKQRIQWQAVVDAVLAAAPGMSPRLRESIGELEERLKLFVNYGAEAKAVVDAYREQEASGERAEPEARFKVGDEVVYAKYPKARTGKVTGRAYVVDWNDNGRVWGDAGITRPRESDLEPAPPELPEDPREAVIQAAEHFIEWRTKGRHASLSPAEESLRQALERAEKGE